MDLDALINAICAKVQERIAACENGSETEAEKPKYLVVCEEHGTKCHECLECPVLGEHFAMECALAKDWDFDLADYEGIVAFGLTAENLGKIANGILDTPYTKTFGKAILLGKKIFVPETEVELYQYKDTAPKGYYSRLEENLTLLKKCGVLIGSAAEVQKAMLKDAPVKAEAPKAQAPAPVPAGEAKETVVKKKVVTEKDLITARNEGAAVLVADQKSIITDLAKDYAAQYGIVIEKRAGVR